MFGTQSLGSHDSACGVIRGTHPGGGGGVSVGLDCVPPTPSPQLLTDHRQSSPVSYCGVHQFTCKCDPCRGLSAATETIRVSARHSYSPDVGGDNALKISAGTSSAMRLGTRAFYVRCGRTEKVPPTMMTSEIVYDRNKLTSSSTAKGPNSVAQTDDVKLRQQSKNNLSVHSPDGSTIGLHCANKSLNGDNMTAKYTENDPLL